MKYSIGMSAGDARDLGLEVPSGVPDCATLKPTGAVVCSVGESTEDQKARRELRPMLVSIPVAWSWVSISGTVVAELES